MPFRFFILPVKTDFFNFYIFSLANQKTDAIVRNIELSTI